MAVYNEIPILQLPKYVISQSTYKKYMPIYRVSNLRFIVLVLFNSYVKFFQSPLIYIYKLERASRNFYLNILLVFLCHITNDSSHLFINN